MSVNAEQWAFLKDEAKLIQFAEANGYMLLGGDRKRTKEQQAVYYTQGLSKTLDSLHQLGLANDFDYIKDGKLIYDKAYLQPLGDYWESLNPKNRWGGNWESFYDPRHFERRRK